jgi:hypothetical protein
MPAGQAEEIIALALVFVVHVVGAVMLVWALLDGEQRSAWRRPPRPPGGGDDKDPPPAPQPPSGGGRALRPSLPLRDSQPSRMRLREPVRVADAYRRPLRRPGHPPATPAPQPAPPARRRRS